MQPNSPVSTDPAGAPRSATSTSSAATAELRESIDECCAKVRDSLEQKAAEMSESAVHCVGHYVDIYGTSLQRAAESLQEQGADSAARFTRQASDRLKDMAGAIERANASEALEYATKQVRLHPAAAIGCALAAGFISARLLGVKNEQNASAHHYENVPA